MAFRAELTFDEMNYRVLDYHYTMARPTDYATGQVSGRVQAGRLTFNVEIVPGQSLWPYIITNKQAKSGKLVLRGGKEDSALKTIEFTNALVIEMTENFSAVGGQPASMTFTISCEKVKEDGAEHENEWSRALDMK